MTRQRIFGSDRPFCDWVRRHDMLPSASPDFGLCVDDVDLLLHCYKTAVDRLGTREVQSLMMLEVKTRRGDVPAHQLDTLRKLNAFQGIKHGIRHYGVSILRLSGTTPDDSELFGGMLWGRFQKQVVHYRKIVTGTLLRLMRFEIHPDTFRKISLRRHHKTGLVIAQEMTPLGFLCDTKKAVRS